jgi:hypothetical protein
MVERGSRAADRFLAQIERRWRRRGQAAAAPYTLAGPDADAEIEAMLRESEILKDIGREILDEPVPERLRDLLRQSLSRNPDRSSR